MPKQKTLKITAGLIVLFLCKLVVGYSQTTKPISIGVVDSFKSALLNEKRELLISVPKSFAANKSLRYPVVYLLDGDIYFQSCTATIDHLSAANGNAVIPEMMVVGLPNTDRVRDLTTSATIQNPGSGGAEKFTSFLEKELIPYIEKHYPTAPYRMLVGHSLGGLFVMNALVNHTALFNAYLAMDPSLWWDNKKLLTQAQTVLKTQNQFANKAFFLATSDMGDTIKIKNDTTASSLPTRSLLELSATLDKNKQNGLKFGYKTYNNEAHGTLPLIGTYDALHFFFDFFKRPSFAKIPDPTFNADSILGAHYKKVSNLMGYKIIPPSSLVNGIAWLYAINKVNDKAAYFYKMNIDFYPADVTTYYALAQFYEDIGDVENAIVYFNKSLVVADDLEIRKKIVELKGRSKKP